MYTPGKLINLKARRAELKISQEQVARNIGLSLSGYQKIESCRGYPSIIIAKRIAAFLEMDVNDVAEWEEETDKKMLKGQDWLVEIYLDKINKERKRE